MNLKFILTTMLLIFMGTTVIQAQDIPEFNPKDIDIPHQKFVLDNGLRLIVHEDHKAPIVAVNVWYHVGSKNEKPGKSGFAHLFEHLMFNGSENFNDDYFQALQAIGATDLNGTTNNDRTNYFQNVPTAALDQVLFLESDRMGHLLGAIDQARLDEQRGVVQNEKRQGENQPYGRQWEIITKEMYPNGHPYSWTVIGSMDDLNAASLEDVKDWFKAYYGTANAVLVVAGDVDPQDIYNRVNNYFGDIASGPTLIRPEVNIPKRSNDTRASYEDRVPEARITMVWNTAQMGIADDVRLDLISNILSSGKNSRLYKRLIYEDQMASSATAFQWTKEISGNFVVQANVKSGYSVADVENIIHEELEKFLAEGPTEEEMKMAKAQYFSGFIKGLERIGGFGGKSDVLAMSTVYGASPDAYKKYLNWAYETTTADIKEVANKWISSGKFTLVCKPFPEYSTVESTVDRSKLPELTEPKTSKFPDIQKATLSNGMKVVLAQRSGVPTVIMNMVFDAGFATDQFASPGTAALSMNMMDEGTKQMNSLEINERLQLLGATLGAGSSLDNSFVNMSTLIQSLDPSLDLFADVVLNPAFPDKEFDRLKQEQLAGIQREKSTPIQMAIRVFPKFLYGEGHAYSMPLTGSGFGETVSKLTRADVVNFYDKWIVPNNATLVVVGDIGMDELQGKLEKRFGSWKKGSPPVKTIAKVDDSKGKKLYLMDRPESMQSVIIAGYLIEPYGKISEVAKDAMNNVLGGQFVSRVNLNLREDKGWSYGARTLVLDAEGQRPMLVYAPVQTDKTSESVSEIMKEFDMFTSDKPITKEEFEKDKNNTVLMLPGMWETNAAVAGSLNEMVTYNLDDDYYQTYDQKVRNLTLDEVRGMGKKLVDSGKLNWFVVGDKEKILPNLEKLGFEEIIIVDGDGNPVDKKSKKVKP